MDRLLRRFAKPWQLPPFLFVLLLGLNRLIFKSAFKLEDKPVSLMNLVPGFTGECLFAFLIAAVLAISIVVMLKMFPGATGARLPFADILLLGLKSQSFYLLAAPIALAVLSLNNYFNPSLVYDICKFLKGLFPLSIFIALFFLLKQEFKNLSEIRLLGLVLSPYLLFVGFLVAGLAAIVALIALVVLK